MTPKQRKQVTALLAQAWAVRGVQLFIIGLGVYLAIWDKRGWPAVLVAAGCAAWLQTQLPPIPEWAKKLQQDD